MSLPICHTLPRPQYALPLARPLARVTCTRIKSDSLQVVDGTVAAKGDFKGEQPETEEAKKQALTGADIVIIPAGVPRMLYNLP